ncbi:FGGY family carbohydrate kinase [Caulobacter sp. 602-1]|uniref:FGGY family carbohydrate kinase n=1 Tax=Caulobacter sp. 602-1 TaxID=2492472 RepID=UPI000F63E68F|nr:FGGY family carbohydrate kinase [Caulobacter sp. 602-1]RRN63895.1 glycerol kinase [Caulobacter sp. 602-1]
MAGDVILAIDQGTTNTKALLVGPHAEIVARASRPMTLAHPRPGWTEQNAEHIWASVAAVIEDLVVAAPGHRITAVAISNQRETIVAWDARTGRPIAPAISWQCRRSSERCARLRAEGLEAFVSERSGLGLDPLFPAAKLAWLLEAVPEAAALATSGDLRVGTIDSWLLWNLTGGKVHATDLSNASRTQLLNLRARDWDPELAALFGVPLAALPRLQDSDADFGRVAAGVCALPADIPVRAIMGDSHAALFGHVQAAPGAVKATIGTGSSIMAATDSLVRSTHGLSSTIAWSQGGETVYALEGNITVSGQAAAFATQLLGAADEQALTDLATSVETSDGVVFVPALAGLGAPHWDDRARGAISGMTLGTRPAHVARATFEAIALQIVDVIEAMQADLAHPLSEIRVDGGATRNTFLLQLLSDLLSKDVARQDSPEASALGVARMAALALDAPMQAEEAPLLRFTPRMADARRSQIQRDWRQAIARARSHA